MWRSTLFRLATVTPLLLGGGTGCVSMMALDTFKSIDSLEIEQVYSYLQTGERVASICVSGQYGSTGPGQYRIPVTERVWERRCTLDSIASDSDCSERLSVIGVSDKRIEGHCENVSASDDFIVRLESPNSTILSVDDARSGLPVLRLDARGVEEKFSPLVIPLLPVTVAMDVLTLPFQIAGLVLTVYLLMHGG